MLASYENTSYQLSGSWDSDDGLLYYWFPYQNFNGVAWALQEILLKRSVRNQILEPTMQYNTTPDPNIEKTDNNDRQNLAVFSGLFLLPSAETIFRQIDLGAAAALRMPLPEPKELYKMHVNNQLQGFGRSITNVFMSSMIRREPIAEIS
jgi:hypothetical protein